VAHCYSEGDRKALAKQIAAAEPLLSGQPNGSKKWPRN
jgi:hypothetical protein